MKNILLLITFLGLSIFPTRAQSFIEIGDGTLGTNYPIFFNHNYSWTSFMFTSAEMGDAKTIDKIAFFGAKNFGGYQKDFLNQKVYLKLTTEPMVRTSYPDMVLDNYTQVFEGTVSYPANGADWMIIEVDDFEYDGTSNLIVHWENHSGASYASLNMFYGSSVDQIYQVATGGDSSFPATDAWREANPVRPNMRVYSPGDDSKPATPTLMSPSNDGVKVSVDAAIEFSLGNTDKYDVYFGTQEDDLQLVEDDVVVTEDGVFSYNPVSNLVSKTKYYFQVIAYLGEVEESSPVYSFTTQKVITDFPFNCGFEAFHIGSATGAKVSDIINRGAPLESDWTYDNNWKVSWLADFPDVIYMGEGTAQVGLTGNGNSSLMTPRINLPENHKISFAWKKDGAYSSSVNTYFEISTDGGENWDELKEFEYEGAQEYQIESISLKNYSGDNVFIRWRHRHSGWSYSSQYFALDAVKISELSNSPEAIASTDKLQYPEVCVGSELSQIVNVSNAGLSDLVVRGCSSTGPFSCDFVGTVAPGESQDLVVKFKPTAEGNYQNDVVFDCNTPEGSFKVSATASAYLPSAEFSHNFDDGLMPENWLTIEIESDASSYVKVPSASWDNSANSGSYSVVMNRSSNKTDPMFLITEGVRNFDVNRLVFQAKKSLGVTEDLPIEVGTMLDPTDPSTFKLMKSINLSSEYVQYSVLFSQDEEAPYIAFRRNAMNDYTKVYIDDIIWENLSNAKPNAAVDGIPVNDKQDVNHYMPIALSWKDGGNAPTGFKLTVAKDEALTDVIVDEDFDISVTSYLLDEALEYATTYYWQVTPYNAFGDCSEPALWSFTTMADPTITSLPYSEDFDLVNYVQDEVCLPLGWSFEDVHADAKTWNLLTTDVSVPEMVMGEAAVFADYSTANEKDDYLYTPAFSLEAGKEYEFSFKMHTIRDVASQFHYEEIEVLIGNDYHSSSLESAVLISDFTDNDTWKDITAIVEVDVDGDYFIALHAISDVSAYKLIVDEVAMKETTTTDLGSQAKGKMVVSPNPTSGTLNVKLPDSAENVAKVYNQLGSVVYTQQLSGVEAALQLDFLPNGWYCLVVESAEANYKEVFIKK
ncbi:T9SS-dependent choice-of-anchor J family protein [Labilibacter marinus]|uniref:T9SS-dependent choice-of-anchor J family protein n=1 Tax=Labilibacter marinus TaxID=1477105 RepID=UPI000836EA5F|nr:choice-of-anchor J domain-containing protein [Labilibacter marinus]